MVDRRTFRQYHFTYKVFILDRHAICGSVGEVLVTVRLYLLDVVAITDLEALTRQPTKCSRTTRLEAYVKVAPVSGSTNFLWDFSLINAVSRLQLLPCNKRSAGSASQNFRITACLALAIALGPIMHSKYLALANISYGLKMHFVVLLHHVYVLDQHICQRNFSSRNVDCYSRVHMTSSSTALNVLYHCFIKIESVWNKFSSNASIGSAESSNLMIRLQSGMSSPSSAMDVAIYLSQQHVTQEDRASSQGN